VTPEVYQDAAALAATLPNWEPTVHKTLESGCSTPLVAALDPALPNGSYLVDCQPYEASDTAKDDEKARQLWELSEQLTGAKFL